MGHTRKNLYLNQQSVWNKDMVQLVDVTRARLGLWMRGLPLVQYFVKPRPCAIRKATFVQYRKHLWTIEALSHLVERSFDEDQYGIVQKNLPDILATLLQLQEAIERHIKLFPFVNKKTAVLGLDAETRCLNAIRSCLKTSLYRIVVKFGDHIDAVANSLDFEQKRRIQLMKELKE